MGKAPRHDRRADQHRDRGGADRLAGQRRHPVPSVARDDRQNFTYNDVTADKAYSSQKNLRAVEDAGGTLYIPFRGHIPAFTAIQPSLPGTMSILYKMQHLFAYQRDTFLAHYHKRSNVDTTFSMIKRKFGDSLRSKSDVGQMNEILLQGDRTQLVRADLLRVRGRTVDAEVRESGDCVGL